ncbi:MAG: LuxR family transcriptional regulator [Acidaminococcaceae bacterium]
MKKTVTATEWLKFIGKEKLQTFQDFFTRAYGISLCFMDLEGTVLTVFSNSSLFCHTMMNNGRERCELEKRNAIKAVRSQSCTKVFTCYMGLVFFLSPVFYNNKLVAVAYAGGMAYEDNNIAQEVLDTYHIKLMNEKNLTIISALLTQTLNLLNLNVEQLEADEADNSTSCSIFANLLSKREEEVARLICGGFSNRQIAEKLFISEKTVKTHVSNILIKLDLKDRMQLIVEYCRSTPS